MKNDIDVHNYEKRLEGQLRVIDRADILPKNKETILKFHNYCFAEGLSIPRIVRLLQYLHKLALWLGKDFEEATKDDIVDLVQKIEREKLSVWTKQGYRVTLKKFYRWLKNSERDPEEVAWIKTSIKKTNDILPDELLTEDEVKQLIEACEHPRDRALVSTLYESSCRIGEICSLHIRNVSFDDYGTVIIVRGKTGGRRVRLIASTPYLASYLDVHPLKDDPDAPLWVGIGPTNKNKPLGYPSIRKKLKELAAKAKIKKRVNPHAFRHSRATYLANRLTEAQMNQFLGWTQGSKMTGIYVHMSGRDTDQAIRRIYGLEEEKEEKSPLKPKKCSRCEALNAGTAKFCNKCGAVLDIEVAVKLQERVEGMDKTLPKDSLLSAMFEDKKIQSVAVQWLIEHGSQALVENWAAGTHWASVIDEIAPDLTYSKRAKDLEG